MRPADKLQFHYCFVDKYATVAACSLHTVKPLLPGLQNLHSCAANALLKTLVPFWRTGLNSKFKAKKVRTQLSFPLNF